MTNLITIQIAGMTCGHCVMAVKKELSQLPLAVRQVDIGLAALVGDDTAVTRAQVEQAVTNAGYSITNWTSQPVAETPANA